LHYYILKSVHNILGGHCTLKKIKGHSGDPGNNLADQLAKEACSYSLLNINFRLIPNLKFYPVFNNHLHITSNLRHILKLQDNIEHIIKWQNQEVLHPALKAGFRLTVDWKATHSVWNQDHGINSPTANEQSSYCRSYFIKAIHNLLPTLDNLKKYKPHLYPSDTCNRCHLHTETNDHIWTCTNSDSIRLLIFKKSAKQLQKLLTKTCLTNTFTLSPHIAIIIQNFINSAHFFNNPTYNSLSIIASPGFIETFKGFVPQELTTFFKAQNIPHKHASHMASLFIIWFTKKGRKLIWNHRCNV